MDADIVQITEQARGFDVRCPDHLGDLASSRPGRSTPKHKVAHSLVACPDGNFHRPASRRSGSHRVQRSAVGVLVVQVARYGHLGKPDVMLERLACSWVEPCGVRTNAIGQPECNTRPTVSVEPWGRAFPSPPRVKVSRHHSERRLQHRVWVCHGSYRAMPWRGPPPAQGFSPAAPPPRRKRKVNWTIWRRITARVRFHI